MKTTDRNGVRVKKRGDRLKISIPFEIRPQLSANGKRIVLATTHGAVMTDIPHDGKPIIVTAKAFINSNEKPPGKRWKSLLEPSDSSELR